MECPVCLSKHLQEQLHIEQMPMATNHLFDSKQAAREALTAPFHLTQCQECSHCFNSAFQPMTYDSRYENSLHCSPTFQRYAEKLADHLVKRYGRGLVVEIGCGQGEFLQLLRKRGCRTLGFDPAYRGDDPDVIREPYFPTDDRPSLIVCRHLLEHLEVLFALERPPTRHDDVSLGNVLDPPDGADHLRSGHASIRVIQRDGDGLSVSRG